MERILLVLIAMLSVQISWAREPISDDKITQIINQFQYNTQYREVRNERVDWGRCWIYKHVLEVDYPTMTEPLRVVSEFYIPNRNSLGEDQVPLVMMLPPMGGVNMLDEFMADTFCSRGMAALIITNDFTGVQSGDVPPVEDHDMAFHRTVAGVKAAIAYAEDDPNLDANRIGLFGVSLGAVLGTFAMETQNDISVGYLIVGGGDVPYILAHSDQEEVSRIRRARMKEQNFSTREEYEEFLRINMELDPFDLGRAVPKEVLRMTIARQDSKVPTKNQYLLHEALGEPDARYVNDGHLGTILDSLLWGSSRRDIAEFFEERFELENPRPTYDWLGQFDLDRFLF